MKAVIYELEEWEKRVWPKVVADYGNAVNVSWVCRERLGIYCAQTSGTHQR